MRYSKLAAMGAMALGLSSYAVMGMPQIKTGVAYQGSELDNDAYRPGVGINGFVGSEKPFADAAGAGGFGVRANYSHYNIEGDELIGKDLDEGGIALVGTVGPNVAKFQPRVGGHVGYTRVEDNNYLDLGPDLTADFKVTPQLGVQALVTPSWFINENRSDYYGTKLGLGVTWNVPGA
ncbi:MAG TPA: hypothetical protein VJ385_05425 [Fibrobacteria bacterium]|nr:hypothetical protein [Fibrobacteria bacterium]